jgi:hypothetical protein
MKKFFSKVEAFFKKAFGSSKWEKTASTTLTIVTPMVVGLLTVTVGPAAAAAVAGVLSTVQKDLAAAAVLIDAMDEAGTSATGVTQVVNILGSVKSNLGSILQIAEIKNSGKVSEITTVVNTLVDELDAIVAAAPSVQPAKA